MRTFMDCSFSTPAILSDDSDEPQTPVRSPSRLDFCMQDLEESHDSEMHGMEWACTSFRDDFTYTFIEEDSFAVDIAAPDRSCLPLVEGGEDDPPRAIDAHSPENTDTSHASPIPLEPVIHQVVIKPQAPIPVRPLSVQFQVEAQEQTPPSRTAPQRLDYPHHGFSRSALLQQKTFWNSRHEEWAEWQSRMEQGETHKLESETDDAYTGLATARPPVVESPPPYMRTPPSGLERDLAGHPPRKREQDIHAPIYPRVGDISALRDSYSVNIDRCFFRYPLWTLHKTLYVFNMHQRAAPPASVHSTALVQVSTSSSTLSSYTSCTSGDDEESDSTLVADDGPIPQSWIPMEPLKGASSPQTPPTWNRFCGWELSWYARWELLIGIFQRDHAKRNALDISMTLAVPPESKAAPPPPPGRIFRFTVREYEDDSDDDEDEDYGILISNSSFSVDFDEECERAMAFYNR